MLLCEYEFDDEYVGFPPLHPVFRFALRKYINSL